MRKLFYLLIVSGIFSICVLAQGESLDSQTLNRQIAILYGQRKFDDAIPLAQKVVENEKKLAKNSETHALALANLALLYKEKAKLLKKNNSAELRERQKAWEEMAESSNKAKKLFREALDIHKLINNQESAVAASAKSELAWLVYNFIVSRSVSESRAQIDEAERLYTESIQTQDGLAAIPTDLTLRTILDFADFYMRYVNFEKALPLYERYLTTVEAKYGPKSKGLVPALRAFTEIYFITNRENEAKATADRISAITGNPEPVVPSYPILTLRSRKIETVKAEGFIPIDFSDDLSNLLSYASGAGAISPMGKAVIKGVAVNIVVNESGEVIEAKALAASKYQKEVEEAALASKFRPFSYNGTAQKLRGSIVFRYFER